MLCAVTRDTDLEVEFDCPLQLSYHRREHLPKADACARCAMPLAGGGDSSTWVGRFQIEVITRTSSSNIYMKRDGSRHWLKHVRTVFTNAKERAAASARRAYSM